MKEPKKITKVYQILGTLLLCIALVLLSYNVTSAWLLDESKTSNGTPYIKVIGTIDMVVTTNFDFYNLALAPDTIYETDQNGTDIGTYIRTSTDNNIREIYVRVKFTTNRSELSLYFDGNFTTETVYDEDIENAWVYNDVDGYYYYLGGVGSNDVQFNAGYKVNNSLHNGVADSDVTISMVFDAIQRPYGAYKADEDWLSAPDIFKDFAAYDSGVNWRS